MAPRHPTHLTLTGPEYEEDIGDLSPYLSLPSSTSSNASSATSFSGVSSPRTLSTDDEHIFDNHGKDATSPDSLSTPTNTKFASPLTSLSSPSVASSSNAPLEISRVNSLPAKAPSNERAHLLREEMKALPQDHITISKMRRWIMGIAVVDFDLDSGPVVEGIYPPLTLLPAESQNIAFYAFPDSLQFEQGSQTHSFRIREHENVKVLEHRPPTVDGYIYGFSHFIQRRDSSSKRGYSQRSLVILTQHQYPALYSALATILGPLFDKHGTPMLESASHNIATWPDPSPGKAVELGFLGTVLQVEIPLSIDVLQVTGTSSFNEKYNPRSHILATTAPLIPPPLLLFEACLSNLWSIWECLVLCEPILVFGASPAETSQAIWWLRDLLRPIPTAGDIRPYFTMQDSHQAELVNKLPPKAGLLLGVTNPFFEKSCSHWPHVLSLGRKKISNASQQGTPVLGAPAGPAPGWKTRTHKRYISKDRVLLKKLEHALLGDERAKIEASLAVRNHFCSRSTQLIAPLARYLNSLIPSPSEVHQARKASAYTPTMSSSSFSSPAASVISVFSSPATYKSNAPSPNPSHTAIPKTPQLSTSRSLQLKPFNSDNFFASLKAHGTTLPFKSNSKRTQFYERWLKSPSFGTWLAQQENIVQTVLKDSPIISAPVDSPRASSKGSLLGSPMLRQ